MNEPITEDFGPVPMPVIPANNDDRTDESYQDVWDYEQNSHWSERPENQT